MNHVLTLKCPLFSDDAEVQRQKMVPVLISDGGGAELHGHNCHLPLAHLDSPWPPPIRPSMHPSLQAFFTGTLGIFFPSTMLNTVLTSVLWWNWGVDWGEGQPQREQINGVLLCFCLFVYHCSTFLRGSQLAHAPWDSSFSHAKISFIVVSTPSPSGPVFKPKNIAEKKTNVMKKQTTKNSQNIKRRKKNINTSLYIHKSIICAMLYPLQSDKYERKE